MRLGILILSLGFPFISHSAELRPGINQNTSISTVSASQCLRSDSSGTHFFAGPGCGSSEAVFNDNSAAINFRVESDGNPNMLYVNGTNNRVGVGVSTPSASLDVTGNLSIGSGANKSTVSVTGAVTLAAGAALTLSGAAGDITSASSVTASSFFGDGAQLTGVAGAPGNTIKGTLVTGRVPFANSTGTLTDTSVLTWDTAGSTLTVGGGGLLLPIGAASAPSLRFCGDTCADSGRTGFTGIANGGSIRFASGGANLWSFTPTGITADVATQYLQTGNGTSAAPGLKFQNNSGIWHQTGTGGGLIIQPGGTNTMHLTASSVTVTASAGVLIKNSLAVEGAITLPQTFNSSVTIQGDLGVSGSTFSVGTNGIVHASTQPGIILYQSANQTIGSPAFTNMYWQASDKISNIGWDQTASSDTVTIPTGGGGVYAVSCTIMPEGMTGGTYLTIVYKNAQNMESYCPASVTTAMSCSWTGHLSLAAGDTVKCAYQSLVGSGAVTINGAANRYTRFSVIKMVGP